MIGLIAMIIDCIDDEIIMRPVDNDGNRESEDEDPDEGAEPPDQLNIQDDHRADHGDACADDRVYEAHGADDGVYGAENYDQADEADIQMP